MKNNRLAAITFGFTLMMGMTSAIAVPLYRGLTNPTQTPKEQGWTYLKTSLQTAPTAQATSSGTVLDSGSSQNYAGYFITAPFNLNRTDGYAISFSIKINSESHTKDNRSGFNVIVVSNKLSTETQPYAIELAFWENSAWAYNPDFSRAETVSINNKDTVRHFVLYVKGNSYQLFERVARSSKIASGAILQGSLRQYTGFTPPPGLPNPYTTPNLIFMGDETTSATANVSISNVFATEVKTIQ
jgi:hypothetical protein